MTNKDIEECQKINNVSSEGKKVGLAKNDKKEIVLWGSWELLSSVSLIYYLFDYRRLTRM